MNTTAFDAVDISLITALRADSRERIITLARTLGIPKSTIHDRLRKIRRAGGRFSTLLDWEYLGCSLVVCFITPYDEALTRHPNVNTCLRLSPESLFLECVFATMAQVEAFTADVATRKGRAGKVYPVVTVLKKEGFIPGSA